MRSGSWTVSDEEEQVVGSPMAQVTSNMPVLEPRRDLGPPRALLIGVFVLLSLSRCHCFDLGQCTAALGMENGEIPDEDISASSMYDPSLGPKHARGEVFVFVAEPVAVRIVLELARNGGSAGKVWEGESEPSGRKIRQKRGTKVGMRREGRARVATGREEKRSKKRAGRKKGVVEAKHDRPKSSTEGARGEKAESRRHKTSYGVTCAFSGRSQRKMVAIFSRPSSRGYLPLCYDSKTPLALVPLSFQ
ncbi:hypothetical protein WN48_04765 [Eufriesea mexicana]|nr:hypothetical protein WN48_04765 [Eufriesea mexicana]